MSTEGVARQRVNGALMNQYHGKPICVLGYILKADGGTSFQVKSSDGAQINVRLKQPISEPLSGLVEVYGIGQGKNLVLADGYTTFAEEVSAKFDIVTYNEYVKLINTTDEDNPWKLRT
ncbi:unnamed protein product [Allacma fusca]|uniref:Replication protein A 14 kDa subunit n=1 Tax=Allacma fusca TaxID=39272 RepID=A0A8J2KWC4_9HEXA|nr:unnamed protein product [Allacma fusca]